MTKEEIELAITYLKRIKKEYIEGEGYDVSPLPEYNAIQMGIKALEKELAWIPVGERLPEGYCLFSDIDGCVHYGHYYGGKWWEYDDRVKDVTAWMPLPEPYKAESDK